MERHGCLKRYITNHNREYIFICSFMFVIGAMNNFADNPLEIKLEKGKTQKT